MSCDRATMEAQLEQVWERFNRELCGFICSRVEDEDTAADILQELLIRVHAHLCEVRDMSKVRSWLYQIARHAIIDHYRRRREELPLPETVEIAADPPEEAGAEQQLAASLREIAETLPEPYREALLRVDYEGWSQQALADACGISLSGAKSRVQRARQKLREQLLNCCHFEFDRRGTIINYYQHCCCCAVSQPAC